MKNWQRNRNFRKYENTDGSVTYIITVDGENVEVSEDVYDTYAKLGYKMEHIEHSIKCNRVLQDRNGKAVRDEHGHPIMLPEREVSLDKLIDADFEFASLETSLEDIVIGQLQIEELCSCLSLLNAHERELIESLFFEGVTEREYAQRIGIAQKNVNKKKQRILLKLKNLLMG